MKIIPWANYIGDLLIVLLLFSLHSPISYPLCVLKLPIMGRRNTQNTTITNNVKRKITLSLRFTNHHLLWLEKFNSVSLPSSVYFWSLLMTTFLKFLSALTTNLQRVESYNLAELDLESLQPPTIVRELSTWWVTPMPWK